MCSLSEIRREAKERGLDWSAVQAAYWEVKQAEWEKREHPNEVRQTAWYIANARRPGNWPFWRHGFVARWGRKVDRHDYTVIPGYDEIGQEIGTAFPEYDDDDGTERLFDFLLSPYDKLPSRDELYRKALELVELQQKPVPF